MLYSPRSAVIDYIMIGRMQPNSKSAQRALQQESGFFGLIKVEKALSAFQKLILQIRNHFRNRLGKAPLSSTVNDPNGATKIRLAVTSR